MSDDSQLIQAHREFNRVLDGAQRAVDVQKLCLHHQAASSDACDVIYGKNAVSLAKPTKAEVTLAEVPSSLDLAAVRADAISSSTDSSGGALGEPEACART